MMAILPDVIVMFRQAQRQRNCRRACPLDSEVTNARE
jgi:hypothetical protein